VVSLTGAVVFMLHCQTAFSFEERSSSRQALATISSGSIDAFPPVAAFRYPAPDSSSLPKVDISLLLKPKDEEDAQSTSSPTSVSRAGSVPSSVATTIATTVTPVAPTVRSTVPAKRLSSSQDFPVQSPAKKQSKWSPEEDAKIIQLRGDGMKWEDISKHLPGRSAISCRLHYQNYLERRSEWDEDRKNKLARLYERYVEKRRTRSCATGPSLTRTNRRFKADMWSRIAEEMAIPWRAAEAMHWQMGEHEMARRAGVTPFSLTNNASLPPGAPAARSHVRHGSATPRLQRHSGPRDLPQQLPSLAELTAGLPAFAAPGYHHTAADYPPHHLYHQNGRNPPFR